MPPDNDSIWNKAETIAKIVEFIDWPDSLNEDSTESIIIAVLGDSQLTDALNHYTSLQPARPRTITAIDIQNVELAAACNLAVFSDTTADSLSAILASLLHQNVITVGSANDFLGKGGLIALSWSGNKHHLTIADDLLAGTDISIDPGLLHMATRNKE